MRSPAIVACLAATALLSVSIYLHHSSQKKPAPVAVTHLEKQHRMPVENTVAPERVQKVDSAVSQQRRVLQPVVKKKEPVNSFVYHPESGGHYTGVQGTKISFPVNAFVDDETGMPVTGPVDISLQEYYTMNDIVVNHLHTMSTQGLIETNGMINVQVTANGRLCKLKPGAEMNLMFPKVNDKPGMQLFTVEKTSNNSVIWKPLVEQLDIIDVNDTSVLAEERNIKMLQEAALKYKIKEQERKLAEYNINRPPHYPGGINGINRFLNEKLSLPESYDKQSEGVMHVDFYIDPFSQVQQIAITKELNPELTRQVAVALNNMFFWKNGMKNGKPERFKGSMKLVFKKGSKNVCVASFSRPFEYAPYRKGELVDWKPGLTDGQNQTDRYFSFTSSQLGWINCDRFLNVEQKTQLYVQGGIENNSNTVMIFQKYKAILGGRFVNNEFLFDKIPENEPVIIVSTKNVKEAIYLGLIKTNTSVGKIDTIAYTKVTQAQLNATLKQMEEKIRNNTVATPVPGRQPATDVAVLK